MATYLVMAIALQTRDRKQRRNGRKSERQRIGWYRTRQSESVATVANEVFRRQMFSLFFVFFSISCLYVCILLWWFYFSIWWHEDELIFLLHMQSYKKLTRKKDTSNTKNQRCLWLLWFYTKDRDGKHIIYYTLQLLLAVFSLFLRWK